MLEGCQFKCLLYIASSAKVKTCFAEPKQLFVLSRTRAGRKALPAWPDILICGYISERNRNVWCGPVNSNLKYRGQNSGSSNYRAVFHT